MPNKKKCRRPVKKKSARKKNSVKDLVAKVAARLAKAGHEPILIGRLCAALYSGSKIKIPVIEFSLRNFAVEGIQKIMGAFGFSSNDGRVFSNKKATIEIILYPPPLTVGDDIVDKVRKMKTPYGELKMLTPTDCVRHRLSSYYKWGETEGLGDAIRVAKRHSIDMQLVKRWSGWEWCGDKFEEFVKEL